MVGQVARGGDVSLDKPNKRGRDPIGT